MLRFAKLATPFVPVDSVFVPKSVARGPDPIDTVTDAFGTRFANASLTVVSTAGLMETPAVAVVGWTVNATESGAAGLTTAVCEAGSSGLTVSVPVTVCEPAVDRGT